MKRLCTLLIACILLIAFYGIVVRMQSEKGGKHHKPHIHCIYGDGYFKIDPLR